MTMNVSQHIITILAVILGTMATRFIPFILFPADKSTPKYVEYLGKVLPAAALLVVYSPKDVEILTGNHGIPELIAIGVVVSSIFGKSKCSFP